MEVRRSSRSTKGKNSRLQREMELELEPMQRANKRKKSTTPTTAKQKQSKRKKQKTSGDEHEQETAEGDINCVCGQQEQDEDDERIMCECEKCLKWQHVECMFGVEDANAVPDGYLCHECRLGMNEKKEKNGKKKKEESPLDEESKLPLKEGNELSEEPMADITAKNGSVVEGKDRSEEVEKEQELKEDEEEANQEEQSQGEEKEEEKQELETQEEQQENGTKQTKLSISSLTDKVRISVAKALSGILEKQGIPEAIERGDFPKDMTSDKISETAEELAMSIEKALYDLLANKKQKDVGHKYRDKFRSLSFNLKDEKNPELRRRIVMGELDPQHIVELSTDEMLNPELQKLRENVRKESIRETVLKVDDMPRMRKTHKGEEVVGADEDYVEEQSYFGVVGENERKEKEKKEQEYEKRDKQDENVAVVGSFSDAGPTDTGASREVSPSTATSANGSRRRVSRKSVEPWDRMDDVLYSPEQETGKDEEQEEDYGLEGIIDETNEANNPALSTARANAAQPARPAGSQAQERSSSGSPLAHNFVPWAGSVVMPEVGEFEGISSHLNSTRPGASPALLWPEIVRRDRPLILDGRLDTHRAVSYLDSVGSTRDIASLILLPNESVPGSNEGYVRLFDYFKSRNRYGVLKHETPHVKDSYLVPIGRNEPLPNYLGLSKQQADLVSALVLARNELLLAVYVTSKNFPLVASPAQGQGQQRQEAQQHHLSHSPHSSHSDNLGILESLGLSPKDFEALRNVLAAHPEVANNPDLPNNPQLLLSLLQRLRQ